MTKIGILTYHNTTNYGALLQALALGMKIKELNGECEIINYHCKNIEKREFITFPSFQKNPIRYAKNIRNYFKCSSKRKVIRDFTKRNLMISNKDYYRNNIAECNKEYDKIVVGSDMVFELGINGGDMTYYLDFADPSKRYSYAASLGVDRIDDKYVDSCIKELEQFQHISVRENQAKDYLSKILKNKVDVDVDPTLLHDGVFWEKYEDIPKEKIDNYILLYFLDKNGVILETAKKISKENNLKILLLTNNKTNIEGCRVINNATVGEFLYYIHHASLVITASFHGMIFAMNYNTNFMYCNKDNTSSRLENIAIITDSTDRRLTKDHIPEFKCNFKKINKAVEKARNKSTEYIKSLVGEIKNNVTQIQKTDCCGCGACSSVCPVNAITMIQDKEGFLYPQIDESKCINCGLCLKTCKKIENSKHKGKLKVYAAKNKSDDVLKKSSSGGISNALCEHFIKNDGIVYGVVYNENHEVIIERQTTLDKINKLYGSKYVQANPKNTFREVYDDLNNNKSVLYIATSCYIAKLKSYLEIKKCKTDKLYTVDLICHGTPSPKLFEDYIDYLKRKYDFDHFEFRTKERPWGYGSKNYGCTIYLKNGKKITDTLDSRLYLSLFFSNYCLRPHCHNCLYASVDKPSDITIADYWGLKDAHPDFFDEKGVSAVLIHTDKGEKLFKDLDCINYIESTLDKVSKKQANLNESSLVKGDRNDFWDTYYKKGFVGVCKKHANLNLKGKIKSSKLYRNLKSIIKK